MKKVILIIILAELISCQQNREPNDKMMAIKKAIEESENNPNIVDDQLIRKEKSEKLIEANGIKLNKNLPYTESEKQTTLRTPKEIAQRVAVLAAVNMVAFDNFSGKEISDYLKKYKLWEFTTENEKIFLLNPNDQAKQNETWKVEGIWTLLWAIKVAPELDFPKELADLNKIPGDKYPFLGLDKDPNIFINKITETRTKSEILDATDFYYRIDWACVDARLNKITIENANSGIVYERHFALNWLVNYMNEDWDGITCDT